MPQHIKSAAKLHTDHALLALLGAKFQQSDFFAPVRNLVQIKQKTVLHQPTDKLLDCLLGMLAGNVAVYQSNTNVLGDTALHKAFGRTACADQSTIQRTLDATTPANVQQLQHSLALIFQTYSRTAKHDFSKSDLIVDIDMTSLPCSKTAQAACPGYFAGCKKGTSGRQLLRVSASQYDEIIYQQVLPGNAVCHDLALLQLVLVALWQILRNCAGGAGTTAANARARIILRLDGGFGTAAIVNYLLAEGYQVVVKQFNGLRSQKRATELAETDWLSESEILATGKVDPNQSESGRQFALLTDDGFYELGDRKLWQIAVRCPTKPKAKKAKAASKTAKPKVKAEVVEVEAKTKYAYTMLLVARRELAELEAVQVPAVVAAQLEFYDGRAVIESASFRGDKQGLGLAKRRKHSLSGQEFLVLLAQLAHNLVSWAKNWLGASDERLRSFGTKRMIRDILASPAHLTFEQGRIVKVRFERRHPLLKRFRSSIEGACVDLTLRLIWRET
jgi:hypothetical protein